jgi:hypothetical protein
MSCSIDFVVEMSLRSFFAIKTSCKLSSFYSFKIRFIFLKFFWCSQCHENSFTLSVMKMSPLLGNRNLQAKSRSVWWLSWNVASSHTTIMFFHPHHGIIDAQAFSDCPKLFGCCGSSREDSLQNVCVVNDFRPHAGFTAVDEFLLLFSARKILRVAFVELQPIPACREMIEIPARREKHWKAVMSDLKPSK